MGPDPRERPVFRPGPESEVADELEFHMEMRIRELMARGLDEAAARSEVRRRMGDVDALRRRCEAAGRRRERRRDMRTVLSDTANDVRFALRQLRSAPSFALAAGLTLAIGIGGTTAVFSVINAVVLKPFAFPEPERVVAVSETYRGGAGDVSAGNFVDWQASQRSFEHMAAMRWTSFNLSTEEAPERVLGLLATADYFDVFGVRPLHGRTFRPEEDVPGADGVVVLSHGLWSDRFEADPAVVGREIRLNGEPHTVIGVMPESFDPYSNEERLWVPIAFTAAQRQLHDDHYLTVVARLAAGVTLAQARADMEAIAASLRERYPGDNAERSATVTAFGDSVVNAGLSAGLWVMLGAVGLVLLIACGNVANLLLARGASRARELSVRAAVGAGRTRLVRQLLTECMVLAVISAAVGVGIAFAGVRALIAAAPAEVPRLATASIDGRVLLFALGVSVGSGLLFGLAPMLGVARQDLFDVLREGGRGSIGRARDRLRGAFVAGEVALAFTLLAGAGLLIRTTMLLGQADPGFEAEGVLSARISLAAGTEGDPAEVGRTFLSIAERLDASPALESAALSSQVPAGPGGGSNGLLPEGRPFEEGQTIVSRLRLITPDYFETMGIPLLSGRTFDATDVAGGDRVMIISRRVAEAAWPGESAIGKRIVCCEGAPDDPRWKTVVGVVGDVRWRGHLVDQQPEFFLPLTQAPPRAFDWIQSTMTIVARGRTEATGPVAEEMRAALRDVAPDVPLFDVRTMEDRLRGTYATNRFAAQLLGVLGAVGLLLAVIGTYGVVAYHASQRTHEIGLRMALGASARDVLSLVTRQGVRPVLIGLVLGFAAALAATRLLQGGLYGVTPTDPLTYGAVALVLLLAGVTAALLPARRAARVDPGRVLTRG